MFLLDANFISQANYQLYPPAVFPGFWNWLQIENRSKRIFRIISVYEELTDMRYAFKIWNDDVVNGFF